MELVLQNYFNFSYLLNDVRAKINKNIICCSDIVESSSKTRDKV